MSEKEDDILEKISKSVYTLSKKRKGRSFVWNVLAEIQRDDGTTLSGVVYCRVCCKLLKYSLSQTSNLGRHKCCNAEKEALRTVEAEDKKAAIEACTEFVVEDCRPFSVVCGSGFAKMVTFFIKIGAKYGGKVDVSDLLPDPTTIDCESIIKNEPSPGSDLENLSQNDYTEKAPPMHPSCSTQSMKEYYQSDRPVHPPSSYRHSQMDLSEWEEQQQQQHPSKQQHHPQQQQHSQTINHAPRSSLGSANVKRNVLIGRETADEWDDGRSGRIRRSEGRYYDSPNTASTPALHHHSGYHRRPASRSANLLSATLCLIKELDYSSLEVIEHAVRCRIDELSND